MKVEKLSKLQLQILKEARLRRMANFTSKVEKYNTNPIICLECKNTITYKQNINGNKYCSRNCAHKNIHEITVRRYCINCGKEFKSKHKGQETCSISCNKQTWVKINIQEWKEGKITGYDKGINLKKFIRRYIFEKYESKCCKCGWSEVHPITGKIPLQVNHIDGNAKNCEEENLELLCPNCHSLTPNFGRLNKNSARENRYKK